MKGKLGWGTNKSSLLSVKWDTNKLVSQENLFRVGVTALHNTLVGFKWRYSAVFHFQWIVWEILQVAKDSPPNKTFCITYNGRKRDEDKIEIPLISVVECSLKWFYSVVLRSGFCYRLSHWIKLENLCLVTPTEATWHEWWHLPQSIRQFYSVLLLSLVLSIRWVWEWAEPFLPGQRMTGGNPSRAG